jgi:hypothetical protein
MQASTNHRCGRLTEFERAYRLQQVMRCGPAQSEVGPFPEGIP